MVVGAATLDTSVIIEILDRGDRELLHELLDRYRIFYIPWICLYEYLYGHKFIGSDIAKRKNFVEKLGIVVWCDQRILMRALEIDIELSKKGLKIPFSDVLVAAIAMEMDSELVTLDTKHFSRIPQLKMYVPRKHRHI